MNVVEFLFNLSLYAFFIYSVLLLLFYLFIAGYSIGEVKNYLRKSSFTNYSLLASSEFAPPISILAPAYNEGATIIENVRSLLALHYNNLELIIINDGSKDDTMDKLIKAYDLAKVTYTVSEKIKTK